MNQSSEVAVVVKWLNPDQSLSLYPQVLDGFEIVRTHRRPSTEYYFLESEVEAQDLKRHLEQKIPMYDYRIMDEANHLILDKEGNPLMCREPTIDVVVFPRTAPA